MRIRVLSLVAIVILVMGGFIVPLATQANTERQSVMIGDNLVFRAPTHSLFYNESELIDEFTWSVMRYDHVINSDNFGLVSMPKPSPGPLVIIANMLSCNVCDIAVSLCHGDKLDILDSLQKFDCDSTVVGLPYIFWSMFASRHSLPVYSQKASAIEMNLCGDKIGRADYVGDCYAQSLFNTAILRLCGFSPEEVFTLLMPMHAVVIVKLDAAWMVFDSVRGQFSENYIYDSYSPPVDDIIYWLENDKYFINFGTLSDEAWPYQEIPYSNIEPALLIGLIEQIVPLFNNSTLGAKNWELNQFLENATPCGDMTSIAVPFSVKDVKGASSEEKAQSLLDLNYAFVFNQTGNSVPNQYDRSLYTLGLLSVTYPQAYANAAKYGSWTSWFATIFDARNPDMDIKKTVNWVNLIIKNIGISNDSSVFFSDFSYRVRRGSSIDSAIVAYGTLRNMEKNNGFWQPEDMYIIVDEYNNGYLAVNTTVGWQYHNFRVGSVSNIPPENIRMSFNEIEVTHTWEK